MLELYENIKKYRKANHMSQEELAKLTGYTNRSSIAKIEKGLVDVPQSKLQLFSDALHVSKSELTGESDIKYVKTEEILIESFGMLNDEGQRRLMQYLADLLDTGKYERK